MVKIERKANSSFVKFSAFSFFTPSTRMHMCWCTRDAFFMTQVKSDGSNLHLSVDRARAECSFSGSIKRILDNFFFFHFWSRCKKQWTRTCCSFTKTAKRLLAISEKWLIIQFNIFQTMFHLNDRMTKRGKKQKPHFVSNMPQYICNQTSKRKYI